LDALMHDAMSDTDPVTHALADGFRRSPIAMVVFSATGVIEHVNGAMARLVGVPADLLVGRTADSVVHPDDVDMIRLFAQFDSDREPVALDHRIIRSDGEVRWLRSTVVALPRAGTHSFFVQSVDHTTARRQDLHIRSIDPVTGLLSRDGLMSQLDDLLAAFPGRSTAPYVLFAVDIDDFRGVNDRLGPLAADRALYLVGACIRAALPVGVAVARVGADVFVALAPGMSTNEANTAMERLLAGLRASSIGLGLPVLGYKLGAVAVLGTDVDPAAAVRLVEEYARDRAASSESVVVEIASSRSPALGTAAGPQPAESSSAESYPGDSHPDASHQDATYQDATHPDATHEVSEWASAIESAIDDASYIAVGEPLRAMHDRLRPRQRFELFVRLVLAGDRWVSLPKFEPHAQRIGRAADVDRWMVTFAAGLLAANPSLELEVNVSRATLGDSSFVDHLAGAFRADLAGSARLLLAVTEHDVAADVRQALTFSEAVRALGVGICLDDHGSVADGVRYLSLIGARRVKLTGQYVRGAKQSSSDRAMVGVLARAARELGIEVAAPFVTDDAIYGILAAVGVDLAQGRLIGHAERLTLPV
jgi:PAS domain S-box-containing protein/diguanylate cyclase (GGDEF)-like protein